MKIIKRMLFVGLVALALFPLLQGLAVTGKAGGPKPKPDIDVEPTDDSGVGLLSIEPTKPLSK